MTITNIVLMLIVIMIAAYLVYFYIKKQKEAKVEEKVSVDYKTY